MRSLTPEQKQQVLQLGKDSPRLWKAPTTSACDRKRMLRLLIRDITVVKGAEPKLLHLQIRWQGGATETIDVRRQPNRAEATRYPDTFVAVGGGEEPYILWRRPSERRPGRNTVSRRRDTVPCMHSGESGKCGQPAL